MGILHREKIGKQCVYFDNSLVHVKITLAKPPGLLATSANNVGMRSSVGRYLILFDDDQIMTTPKWNSRLSLPFRRYEDVFSVSMRCAHTEFRVGGPKITHFAGSKCKNTLNVQKNDSCVFHVRDSGNRGPLMIREEYARRLGYLDELHFMGVFTTGCDHDFNERAWKKFGWVSGQLSIDYTEERCCRSPHSHTSSALTHRLRKEFYTRKANTEKSEISRNKSESGLTYKYKERYEARIIC